MDRISAAGHVNRRFSEGVPGVQRATVVSAEWLNGVQEELLAIIEGAGMTPSSSILDQVYQAIVLTVAGAVGTGGGEVPTTRVVGTSGLASGGGNLAADRTINVAKASAADVLAGTADDRAITPLALASAAAGTIAANGYVRLPGGLIIQWGTIRGNYGEASVSVTLPIAFPNNVFSIVATTLNSGASLTNLVDSQNVSRSLSSFTIFQNYANTGGAANDGFDWQAIGN